MLFFVYFVSFISANCAKLRPFPKDTYRVSTDEKGGSDREEDLSQKKAHPVYRADQRLSRPSYWLDVFE